MNYPTREQRLNSSLPFKEILWALYSVNIALMQCQVCSGERDTSQNLGNNPYKKHLSDLIFRCSLSMHFQGVAGFGRRSLSL